ncbi:hypothetical protein [Streptomyces sulfonofaciens]|uniref:hypothetical protein n=1 Tax=Streptomyces sulfonofaciens TaxID=68272 RepID=UPI001678D289|nr:hypothetical protein [Streptomyces sulfonofaciens]
MTIVVMAVVVLMAMPLVPLPFAARPRFPRHRLPPPVVLAVLTGLLRAAARQLVAPPRPAPGHPVVPGTAVVPFPPGRMARIAGNRAVRHVASGTLPPGVIR